jgi:hypothetical protein
MSIRLQISMLVYLMVQAVLFGIGAILVLATPLQASAMTAMPWVVGITAILSAPVSWLIAPRLRARYWRKRANEPDFISGGTI